MIKDILCIWAVLVVATDAHSNYVLKSNVHFAQNVYKTLSRDPGNFVFSSLSAHSIFSMLYQGAEARTKAKLAVNLYLPDPETTAEQYHEVLYKLNNATRVKVDFINKLYAKNGLMLKQDFLSTTKDKFMSGVELADFSRPRQISNEINQWINDMTNHKIKKVYEPRDFDSATSLVAVNTLYFKGKWSMGRLFLNRTMKYDFYLDGGDKVRVNMMAFRVPLKYKDDPTIGAKVLEMPFEDQRFSMVFILPNERGSLAQLEAKLPERRPYDIDVRITSGPENYELTKLFSNLTRHRIRVRIPPFKIENIINFEDIAQQLGLGDLFKEDECDLSGIAEGDKSLYLSKMRQKVVISVDQNGCEATAATSGFSLAPVSLMDCEFVADHPFLFSLIERSDDGVNILFTGRVSNPLQASEKTESPMLAEPDNSIQFPGPSIRRAGHPRATHPRATRPVPIVRRLLTEKPPGLCN